MKKTVSRFNNLTLKQLYSILQLRNQVFIVEQNCPYLDIDGKDENSMHIFYTQDDQVIAYTRIVPGKYPSIGRVIVAEKFRQKGLAKEIMLDSIRETERAFGKVKIQLQAQTYLLDFYKNLGFEPISDEYLEDNIPHRDMIRSPSSEEK